MLLAADERTRAVLDLLGRYVLAVDRREIERWPDFFGEEASYLVVTRENEERNLSTPIVCDDTKGRIQDRVRFIRQFWGDHYNENWPRHIVTPLSVAFSESGEAQLVASFVLYVTYLLDGRPRLVTTGEYQDVVVFEGGEVRFRSKKVVLDTPVLQEVFVYPL